MSFCKMCVFGDPSFSRSCTNGLLNRWRCWLWTPGLAVCSLICQRCRNDFILPTVILMPHLDQGSEQERLINAVGDMFLLNGKLDDGMQLWRYSPIQGPAMRKFEATCQVKKKLVNLEPCFVNSKCTLQVFFDICERHIQRAMEELKSRKRGDGEDKTLLELFTGFRIETSFFKIIDEITRTRLRHWNSNDHGAGHAFCWDRHFLTHHCLCPLPPGQEPKGAGGSRWI